MGGPGGGRWRNYQRKPRVEETRCLDLRHEELRECLASPKASSGTVTWSGGASGQAHLHLSRVGSDERRWLTLRFGDEDEEHPQTLPVERRKFGFGHRWLARCPGCAKPARKLYWPEGRARFACWRCSGLQYTSAQTHDPRVDNCRRDPRAFLERRGSLGGVYSALTTVRLFGEAERRGIQWMSLRQWFEHLDRTLGPIREAQSWIEAQIRADQSRPRRRLENRRDR